MIQTAPSGAMPCAELLVTREAAALLQVSLPTFTRLYARGLIAPVGTLVNNRLYRRADVEALGRRLATAPVDLV